MGSKKKAKAKAKTNGKIAVTEAKNAVESTKVVTEELSKEKDIKEAKTVKPEEAVKEPVKEPEEPVKSEKTEKTADSKEQEVTGKKQEVVEWKEKESEPEPVAPETEKKKKSHLGMFLLVVMGTVLAAAVLVLAICLYDTSKELRTMQAMSGSLQEDINLAKQKMEHVEQLLQSVEKAEQDRQEEVSSEISFEDVKPTATPRPTPEPEVYTVCLDAGHGGYDTGAVLYGEEEMNRQEKDDNLWMTKLLQKELEAYGVKVIMTREDDTFLELYDRTFIANSMDADALISIHRNAYYLNGKMNDRVSGVEIWVHNSKPTDAMQLAGEMLGALMEVGGMKNRGVKYGSMSDVNENYAINRRAVMTSMIVEFGFISNEEDNAALDTYGEEYAKAMAKEIYEWLQTLR